MSDYFAHRGGQQTLYGYHERFRLKQQVRFRAGNIDWSERSHIFILDSCGL